MISVCILLRAATLAVQKVDLFLYELLLTYLRDFSSIFFHDRVQSKAVCLVNLPALTFQHKPFFSLP